VDPEQDQAGSLEWYTPLQRDLPEVLIQRQDNPIFDLRPFQ